MWAQFTEVARSVSGMSGMELIGRGGFGKQGCGFEAKLEVGVGIREAKVDPDDRV